MVKVKAFYSSHPSAKVYHDNSSCTEGNKIEEKYLKSGTARRSKCKYCENPITLGKEAPFYSSKPLVKVKVYHDNFLCTEGTNIEKEYLKPGKKGKKERKLCNHCFQLNKIKVEAFHSSSPSSTVYHDNTSCTEGNNIEKVYLESGTDERHKCKYCKKRNEKEVEAFYETPFGKSLIVAHKACDRKGISKARKKKKK